eukprot:SAG31_NODE_1948_length_6834_cov_16.124276_1_plen_78_part_00
MHTTEEAKLQYVLAMFLRVEQNSMFSAHIAYAILEMVVELQLHRWPLHVVKRALRAREARRCDGAYGFVSALVRETL